jgi:predicted flap endonuclease-1-like 5' DNA nuclease
MGLKNKIMRLKYRMKNKSEPPVQEEIQEIPVDRIPRDEWSQHRYADHSCELIHGIGRKTVQRLAEYGIYTVADLARAEDPENVSQRWFTTLRNNARAYLED